MTFFARKTLTYLLVVADVEREGDDLRGDVGREAQKAPQVVGFLPNARRDVEVEIVRMLPAATLQATRSPTKPVGAKKIARKKTDLAACNTLESPGRCASFLKRWACLRALRTKALARKTAVHLTFALLRSNRLRDRL